MFNNMIADIISNETFNLGVTGIFFGGRKLNFSPVFVTIIF